MLKRSQQTLVTPKSLFTVTSVSTTLFRSSIMPGKGPLVIDSSNNPGFNIWETKTGQQCWSLLYDSTEKLDDAFFKKLPKVEIANIVMSIGEHVRSVPAEGEMTP
jgi:hypothetical protein